MQNSLKSDNSEEDLRLAFRVFDKVIINYVYIYIYEYMR